MRSSTPIRAASAAHLVTCHGHVARHRRVSSKNLYRAFFTAPRLIALRGGPFSTTGTLGLPVL
jgi:hypothetical protein